MLVAGTLLAAQDWRDFGYVEALASRWRVINVDPLGPGGSDAPHDPDAYEAAGVTNDLVAVLDAEGVSKATVWGYSRGGWLTCGLAATHPDRIDRIVVGGYACTRMRKKSLGCSNRWPGIFAEVIGGASGEPSSPLTLACRRQSRTATIHWPWRQRSTARCAVLDSSTRPPCAAQLPTMRDRRIGSFRIRAPTSRCSELPLTPSPTRRTSALSSQ